MGISNTQFSVVIPLYNEELGLDELYRRLKPVLNSISPLHEIVFVNDGSADETLKKVKALAKLDATIRYLSFSRNFGHQIAVTAGLNHCTGQAVAIMDADLQ